MKELYASLSVKSQEGDRLQKGKKDADCPKKLIIYRWTEQESLTKSDIWRGIKKLQEYMDEYKTQQLENSLQLLCCHS